MWPIWGPTHLTLSELRLLRRRRAIDAGGSTLETSHPGQIARVCVKVAHARAVDTRFEMWRRDNVIIEQKRALRNRAQRIGRDRIRGIFVTVVRDKLLTILLREHMRPLVGDRVDDTSARYGPRCIRTMPSVHNATHLQVSYQTPGLEVVRMSRLILEKWILYVAHAASVRCIHG